MNNKNYTCVLCGNNKNKILNKYSDLFRITSDCRPFSSGGKIFSCKVCGLTQKICDKFWLDEVKEIYSNYNSYPLANGKEQLVFENTEGSPQPRSDVIFRKLCEYFNKEDKYSLLDIGCGNGVNLISASNFFPKFDLYGYEPDKLNTENLVKIKKFQNGFSGNLKEINQKFDIITMFHSLEHFQDPNNDLNSINNLLKENGFLFIQIPNFDTNPYDMIVADHLTHFTPHTLQLMLKKHNFYAISINTDWVEREISMLLKKNKNQIQDINQKNIYSNYSPKLENNFDQLIKILNISIELRKSEKNLNCFGTSIASTWIGNFLYNNGKFFNFFLDEDDSRINKLLFETPVIHPEKAKFNSSVFIPLAPPTNLRIKNKLNKIRPDLKCYTYEDFF